MLEGCIHGSPFLGNRLASRNLGVSSFLEHRDFDVTMGKRCGGPRHVQILTFGLQMVKKVYGAFITVFEEVSYFSESFYTDIRVINCPQARGHFNIGQ